MDIGYSQGIIYKCKYMLIEYIQANWWENFGGVFIVETPCAVASLPIMCYDVVDDC